jgi:hypothetical protein
MLCFSSAEKNNVPQLRLGTLIVLIFITTLVRPGEDAAAEIAHVEAV